jgi:hypothetical protein
MQRASGWLGFLCLMSFACQTSTSERGRGADDRPGEDAARPLADGSGAGLSDGASGAGGEAGSIPGSSDGGPNPGFDLAAGDGPALTDSGSPAPADAAIGPVADAAGAADHPALDVSAADALAAPDAGGSGGAVDVAAAPVDAGAGAGGSAEGRACYREGTCGRGWGCVTRDLGVFGHCLPLGVAGSYCRTSPGLPPCDAGLVCTSEVVHSAYEYPNGIVTVLRSFCRPTVAEGGSCVAAECASGACPPSGPARCFADGALGGRCRDAAPRCDAGYGCARDGLCRAISGGLCSAASGALFGCPEGEGCTPAGTRCSVLGTSSGACRPTAPRCDGALGCRAGVCSGGVARIGQACSSPTGCEDGAGCIAGTCAAAPVGALAGPCRADNSCDAGLVCAVNKICGTTIGSEGRSCGFGSQCLPGLYCVSGVCRKRVAVDQPCDLSNDSQCIEGAYCGYPSGRCTLAGGLGKLCRDIQPGTGELACDEGLVCRGVCQSPDPLPEVSLGQPCAANTNRCESGAVCSGGVCVVAGGFNSPCVQSPEGPCQKELGCSASSRTCVPGKPVGESCGGTIPGTPCALPGICATLLDGRSVCAHVGYTMTPIPSPEWVDACAEGVRVAIGPGRLPRDDGHPSSALLLPFPFKLWGSDRTQVWPSTNGFLSFGTSALADRRGGVGALPDSTKDAIVAPFWDDLYLDESPTSDLCFKTAGQAPRRRFVVEWLNARRFGHPGTSLTFQVVLAEETGAIDFVYRTLDAGTPEGRPYVDGSRAAIGLQSPGAVRYVVHGGAVFAGQGLRFTPPAP